MKFWLLSLVAFITVIQSVAGAEQPAKEINFQETLPTSEAYWQFHRWYMDHSILSVIVQGSDHSHLLSVLREIDSLKAQGVSLGVVAIVGGLSREEGVGKRPGKAVEMVERALKELKLSDSSVLDTERVLSSFDVRFSPVWVIRYRGVDYVYEGLESPRRLFTREGRFRAP